LCKGIFDQIDTFGFDFGESLFMQMPIAFEDLFAHLQLFFYIIERIYGVQNQKISIYFQ